MRSATPKKAPLVGGAGPVARSRLASVPAPHGAGIAYHAVSSFSATTGAPNPARALIGARVVVVNSALRRLYPISCAFQVGNGVLSRLRRRAFPTRSLRGPLRAGGWLKLLHGRRLARRSSERVESMNHIRRRFASAVLLRTQKLEPKTLERNHSR